MNPNLVNKALSQEEQTILANIKSLTEELMSAGAGSADASAGGAEKADLGLGGMLGKPGQEPDGDEQLDENGKPIAKSKNEDIDNMDDQKSMAKLAKDITATPGDGADANDDAEERMDDVLTGLTEENVDAVAKAIAKFRSRKNSAVVKSQSPIVSAIMELSKVVKDISARQMESETAFSNLMDGLGVTKQIESAMDAERMVAKSGKPIHNSDNSAVAKAIGDLMASVGQVKKSEDHSAGANASSVRKNMDTAVSSLLVRK